MTYPPPPSLALTRCGVVVTVLAAIAAWGLVALMLIGAGVL